MCESGKELKSTSLPEEDKLSTPPPSKTTEEYNHPKYNRRGGCVRSRRKFKTELYVAFTSILFYCCFFSATTSSSRICVEAFSKHKNRSSQSQQWIERSVQYYSTVMRKNISSGNAQSLRQQEYSENARESPTGAYHPHDKEFVGLATKHYYARFLIKMGRWDVAEKLYRRIIDELTTDPLEGDCDHTKLAVSTLLLALHMQRTGDIKATRAVFLNFFRRVALSKDDHNNNMDDNDNEASSDSVNKCSCSAKVLQAYALFEMKNGLSAKSLEIIHLAVQMDDKLSPVLEWKQFRDAAAGIRYSPTFTFKKHQMNSKERDELSS